MTTNSISNNSVHHKSFVCAVWMSKSYIRPIDRIPSSATTRGQSGPGNDGIEGVLCIPKSSRITGASPSDTCWGEESYTSAKAQSMYSTDVADWAGCLYQGPIDIKHLQKINNATPQIVNSSIKIDIAPILKKYKQEYSSEDDLLIWLKTLRSWNLGNFSINRTLIKLNNQEI